MLPWFVDTSSWIVLLIVLAMWLFYKIRSRILILVLRILCAPMILGLDLPEVIKSLKEAELYPPHTPEFLIKFFIEKACRAGVKKNLIVPAGNIIIPRFVLSDKGRHMVEEDKQRMGKKRISL